MPITLYRHFGECIDPILVAYRNQLWYTSSMTNTITIRLRRPKAEIQAKAKPNVNAWINDLIEKALEPQKIDWAEHFERKKGRQPVHFCSDDIRKANR
jgi:hypothetical protein